MKSQVLLSFLLLSTLFLTAQSRWSLEAQLGAGFSGRNSETESLTTFSTTNEFKTNYREKRQPGIMGGLAVNYSLNSAWELSLGLQYRHLRAFATNNRESRDLLTGFGQSYLREYSLVQNQLTLPLTARFFPLKSKTNFRPFVQIGGRLSYLLNQHNASVVSIWSSGNDPRFIEGNEYLDVDLTYFDVEDWQIALVGGIGVQHERFSVSLNYDWNVFSEGEIYYFSASVFELNPCATCGLSRSDRIAQLRQTSLRLAYRIF